MRNREGNRGPQKASTYENMKEQISKARGEARRSANPEKTVALGRKTKSDSPGTKRSGNGPKRGSYILTEKADNLIGGAFTKRNRGENKKAENTGEGPRGGRQRRRQQEMTEGEGRLRKGPGPKARRRNAELNGKQAESVAPKGGMNRKKKATAEGIAPKKKTGISIIERMRNKAFGGGASASGPGRTASGNQGQAGKSRSAFGSYRQGRKAGGNLAEGQGRKGANRQGPGRKAQAGQGRKRRNAPQNATQYEVS